MTSGGPISRSWHEPKAPDAIRVGARHFAPDDREAGAPTGAAALAEALETARAGADRAREAELLSQLGADHVRLGRFDWATEAFSEARELSVALGDRDGEARAAVDVAIALARRGAEEDARAALASAPRALAAAPHGAVVRAVLALQGGDRAAALDLLDGAFAAARTLDDDALKAAALTNAAVASLAGRELDEGMRLLQRAVLLAQRTHDELGMARAYNDLGIVHLLRGSNFEAIPFLEIALSLAQRADDRPVLAEILNNNVLAFEQQYLEPAAAFRALLAEQEPDRAARLADAAAIGLSPGGGLGEGEGDLIADLRGLLSLPLA